MLLSFKGGFIMSVKEENYPTSIRLSKYLYEKIKKESNIQKRSITKQIEIILEKYYELKEVN